MIRRKKFQANLEHAAVAVIVGEGVRGVIRFHQVNVLLMKITITITIIIVTIIPSPSSSSSSSEQAELFNPHWGDGFRSEHL